MRTKKNNRNKDKSLKDTRDVTHKVAENRFGLLPSDEGDVQILEQNGPDNEIYLIDSENDSENSSDSVMIISDPESEEVEKNGDGNDDDNDDSSADLNSAPSNISTDEPSLTTSIIGSRKRRHSETENEVTGNNDFIGFGFSSSEDEGDDEGKGLGANENQYSDDGYVSDDNYGSSHNGVEKAFPWVKGQDHSHQKEIADWLTLEIKDFVNYISPSKEEIVIRNNVINNLKETISSFWPATQAHVFGSCATDLYLPGSDIDMVVISTTGDYEQRSRLYQLSSYLRTNRLAKNIQVIASAKVPIIKFVDPEHNINVDVSFERSNGLDAARRIRKWLKLTPGLRELVLIVKQFLRSRKLNDVHVGGLGGYATIIMVYHFLKLHPRISTDNLAAMENLGTLLIEFFELYGVNFSYDKVVIAINNADESPMYIPKSHCPQLRAIKNQFSIIIQDPSDPENNITRSSYNLSGLKKAFVGAYQLLISKCYELHGASYKSRLGALILGDIISFRGKDRDFNDDRDKVVNHALINHAETESESDGADGNDKYYLSDMTEPSDADITSMDTPEIIKPTTKKSRKELKKEAKRETKKQAKRKAAEMALASSSQKPNSTTPSSASNTTSLLKKQSPQPPAHGKKVEDFIGLNESSDEEAEPPLKRPRSSSSMDKDMKRDFWSLKGLEAQ